nr:uncharacterized protein LOC110138649 [Odocoileus virginianus texanus]
MIWGPTQTRTDLEKLRERRRGSSRRWFGDPRRLVPCRADAAPLNTKRFSCTGRYFPKMPRLVGAQNPHRKVPRAARGGTHGVRVSQSSQHPSQTRPSSALRLRLSVPALVSRSLSHPLSDPFPAGEMGRKRLIFFLTKRREISHFYSFSYTKKPAE